jgi:hypothetical protein
MSENFESKITSLTQRFADLGKVLADLKAKRTELAPAAVEGDKQARAELAQLDTASDAAAREGNLITTAIDQIKRLAAQAKEAAAAKERGKREATAAKIAERILATDAEIDGLLKQLRRLFEERRGMAVELRKTNCFDPYLVLKMHNRHAPTAACYAAQLREFISMELIIPEHQRSLASSDVWLTWPIKAIELQQQPQGNSHGNQTETQRKGNNHK